MPVQILTETAISRDPVKAMYANLIYEYNERFQELHGDNKRGLSN